MSFIDAYFQIRRYIPNTQNIKIFAIIIMTIYETKAVEYWEIKTSLPLKSICPLRKKEMIKDEKIISMSNRICNNILNENFLFMQVL